MVPEGFHVIDQNYSYNLTNDYDSILITKELESNDIDKEVKNYVKFKKESNFTVSLSNFTVDGITVCKAKVNENDAIHYWFEKDGKVYEMYTRSGGINSDKLVSDLIKTMEVAS